MGKRKINVKIRRILSDQYTPVGVYGEIREKFGISFLLESSDHKAGDNSFSFVVADPLVHLQVKHGIWMEFEGPKLKEECAIDHSTIFEKLDSFCKSFETPDLEKLSFDPLGLYGYSTYESQRYFDPAVSKINTDGKEIPDIWYGLFRNTIVFDHFRNQLFLVSLSLDEEAPDFKVLEEILMIQRRRTYPFALSSEESSNLTDQEFIDMVTNGKSHCHRGDVFQIVLSRRYEMKYKGDDFNVYRCLRAVNPSPYLFYFDLGGYRLMGSSPEAQLVVKGDSVEIYPIAGTYKRTGDEIADLEAAKRLSVDPKEGSEHVMLVDLARNDLSKFCVDVEVEKFKEIQFYSHVIHLVSKVKGKLRQDTDRFRVIASTFPAGTLSGAPKIKAIELINRIEPDGRGFYGGCIGYMGLKNGFNHAIMIRTFLSKDNTLYFQGGAGVVEKSIAQSELAEVNNKLGALKVAILQAVDMNKNLV